MQWHATGEELFQNDAQPTQGCGNRDAQRQQREQEYRGCSQHAQMSLAEILKRSAGRKARQCEARKRRADGREGDVRVMTSAEDI
jgi:hypothetical protein